ncbi:MAG: cellulase family glycosylhydrolase [Nitrososphaerales archaeon]
MHNLFDERYFAFGVNLAWLDGQYDHDFGKNEVMGYNFRAYDEKHRKQNLEAYFRDISEMGAHVVRLWLFERFEGLQFDNNGNVNGIDEGLIANVADVLNVAERCHLYLYICLMDTWGVTVHAQQHVQRLNAIISDKRVRSSYVDNGVKRFVSDTKLKTNRIFAIDVMNEPEGMYSSIWRRDIEWADIIKFINECARAIHAANIRTSCGFQRYQTLLDNKDYLQVLDFYDYHEYNDDGELIGYSDLSLDKPCIIGECGQKSEKYDDEIYDRIVGKFLNNAWKRGYAGCLIWNYNYKGYDVNDSTNRNSLISTDGKWRRACYALMDFNEKHKRNMIR